MIKVLPSLNGYDMSPDDIIGLSKISPFFNDVIVYSTIEQVIGYINDKYTESLLSNGLQLDIAGPAGTIDVSINPDSDHGIMVKRIDAGAYFILLNGRASYAVHAGVPDKFLFIQDSEIADSTSDVIRDICYLRNFRPTSIGVLSGCTFTRGEENWSDERENIIV